MSDLRYEWELSKGKVEATVKDPWATLTIRSTQGLEIAVTLQMTPGQLRYLGEQLVKLAGQSKIAQ